MNKQFNSFDLDQRETQSVSQSVDNLTVNLFDSFLNLRNEHNSRGIIDIDYQDNNS